MSEFDVVIVGGGIVGAACADRLAGEGLGVCLLEAGEFLREASWAAPGVLHPIHPLSYPAALHPLLRAGPREFRPLAADLARRTGIDVGLATPGVVVTGDQVEGLAAWCGSEIPYENVDAAAFLGCPGESGQALFLPEVQTLRPHHLGRALLEGARLRGAVLRPRTRVLGIDSGCVHTAGGEIRGRFIVLAAGAWSGGLRNETPTVPVRGQILLYKGTFRHMAIFSDRTYVVPRPDGLLLFGSTVEHAGFDGRPTEAAVRRLGERASELLGLKPDDLVAAWGGLRPGTPSGLPFIARSPSDSSVILATGHYRTGVILAPLTARIVADLVSDRVPQHTIFG